MTRILAIADEVEEALYTPCVEEHRPDAVVACGDLPFEYLEYIVTMLNVPLLWVPGNHDPDAKRSKRLPDPTDVMREAFRNVMDHTPFGPAGCTGLDGEIVDAAGLTFAGLGGSIRYSRGPNQYTQRQMKTRALALETRARIRRRRVDVLVTHSPPLGVGDADDPPHRGFAALHRLVDRLDPKVLIHGHVHPYGRGVEDRQLNGTRVINAVGHRTIEI